MGECWDGMWPWLGRRREEDDSENKNDSERTMTVRITATTTTTTAPSPTPPKKHIAYRHAIRTAGESLPHAPVTILP